MPLLFKICKYTVYHKKLKQLKDSNVIYLFDNNYSYLFSHKSVVIGSNHIAFDNPNLFTQKLYARLISLRLMFPSITAFHLFPQNVSLKEYFGNKPLILLSNSVDTDLYYPSHSKNLKTKILFVGRLDTDKGILMAIKVYNNIKKMFPVEFVIVGSGSLESEVDKLCASDTNVKHFKHVAENDLANIYRSCDIFLYPSLYDTYALVVLEALSSGLKVVTTDNLYRVYNDFIRFNVIKFADFDEKSLTQALLDIKDTVINKNDIHNYIEKNYSWKKVSENLFNSMYNLAVKS